MFVFGVVTRPNTLSSSCGAVTYICCVSSKSLFSVFSPLNGRHLSCMMIAFNTAVYREDYKCNGSSAAILLVVSSAASFLVFELPTSQL